MQSTQYGLHEKVPFDQYQQWPAVSKHQLDLIARSPAHFQAAKENPPEVTHAMQFGTAAHTWILEPEQAVTEIAVRPKYDRRTKAGKEMAEHFEVNNHGKTIITEEDARHIAKMAGAVSQHPLANGLVKSAHHIEASVMHRHTIGVDTRCRPDIIGQDIVVDLKTSYDGSRDAFAKTMHKYRYHVQAAFYLDLLQGEGLVGPSAQFVFLVVEKLPPYGVALYAVTPDDVDRGRLEYEADLIRYKHGMETGDWPGYSRAIDYIALPAYARKEIDLRTNNE